MLNIFHSKHLMSNLKHTVLHKNKTTDVNNLNKYKTKSSTK
jgi:hypothetical protein